jgi:hypothetical protein
MDIQFFFDKPKWYKVYIKITMDDQSFVKNQFEKKIYFKI